MTELEVGQVWFDTVFNEYTACRKINPQYITFETIWPECKTEKEAYKNELSVNPADLHEFIFICNEDEFDAKRKFECALKYGT